MRSSFLIGSDPDVPACELEVTANGSTEIILVSGGSYYLDDPTSSLSLIRQFATAILSHAQVSACSAWIGRDRLVHLSCTPATAIDFMGDVHARNMMGFTGNLASATTHNANLISKWLWSPRKTESSSTIFGAHGLEKKDTKVGGSSTARNEWTHHNTIVVNDFSWRYIALDRVWSLNELGGEMKAFWSEVLSKGFQFKLYRNREDVAGDTTDINLVSTLGIQLGPYEMRPDGDVSWVYKREVSMVDYLSPCNLPVIKVPEYD